MKLLDTAIAEIGLVNDPPPHLGGSKKYQDAVGLPHDQGYPWCQSFVYWCGLTAYGSDNPVPKTGGVLDCWHKAVASDTLDTISKADATRDNILPGYQFILDEGHGNGHTGIIESIDTDGTIHTVEGNSNENGSREGYEVCRHSRHLTDGILVGFVCYADPSN